MGVPIGDVARVSQVLLAQLQQSRETTGTRSAASVISQEAVTTGQIQSTGNVVTTGGFFVGDGGLLSNVDLHRITTAGNITTNTIEAKGFLGDGGLLSNISKSLQEITEFGNVTDRTIVNTNQTTSLFTYHTPIMNDIYMPKTVAFPKPAIDISIGGPIAITCSNDTYQTIIFLYPSYFKTVILNPDKQTIYTSADTFGDYDAYAKISTSGIRLLLKKGINVYVYQRYDIYHTDWTLVRVISDNNAGFLNTNIGFAENVDGIDADDGITLLVVGCPRWGNISREGYSTWVVHAHDVGIVKIFDLWSGGLIRNILPPDYFYAWNRYFGRHVGMSRDGSKFIVSDSKENVTRVYTVGGELIHTLSVGGDNIYMKISNDATFAITSNNLHKYLNGSWRYNVHGGVGSLTPSNSFFKTTNNILTKYTYVDGTTWAETTIPSHIGINNIFHIQNDELGFFMSIDNKPVFIQILDELPTKLHVEGNVVVDGNVIAEYLFGDGSNLTGIFDSTQTIVLSNVTTGLTVDSNATVGGNLTTNQLEVLNNANISGTLTKASGTFKIDHPLSNMRSTHTLTHSFIEGPRADLIYRGKTQLVHGAAIVNIDEVSRMTEGTFNALARDAHCFVVNNTNWDAVKGDIEGNILYITCQNAESNAWVNWMVVGERKDDHMYALDWTDDDGRVVPEKLKI